MFVIVSNKWVHVKKRFDKRNPTVGFLFLKNPPYSHSSSQCLILDWKEFKALRGWFMHPAWSIHYLLRKLSLFNLKKIQHFDNIVHCLSLQPSDMVYFHPKSLTFAIASTCQYSYCKICSSFDRRDKYVSNQKKKDFFL